MALNVTAEQVAAFLQEILPAKLDPKHLKEAETIFERYFSNRNGAAISVEDLRQAALGPCRVFLHWEVEPVDEKPRQLTAREAQELINKRQQEMEQKEAARILREKIENSNPDAFLAKMADAAKKSEAEKQTQTANQVLERELASVIGNVSVSRMVGGRSLPDASKSDAFRTELKRFRVLDSTGKYSVRETLNTVKRVIAKIDDSQTNPADITTVLYDAVLRDLSNEEDKLRREARGTLVKR
jgi:hypothetical protein